MFLHFLFERGDISRDLSIIVPRYRERQPLPAVYTVAEIRRIESSIDRTTPRGKMDYAIVLLASRMGLRRSDIVNLTFSSIDFKCDRLRMIQKKNGAELDLLLVAPVKEALIEYLNAYGISEMIGKVFPSIDPMYVSLLVTKQMKSSGIAINGRRKGPHALRSSLATSMVNDDISYETIRHILGHQDHDTVRKYAKLDIEKLRKCALEVPEPTGSYKRALEGGGFYD
jgi:integrase